MKVMWWLALLLLGGAAVPLLPFFAVLRWVVLPVTFHFGVVLSYPPRSGWCCVPYPSLV